MNQEPPVNLRIFRVHVRGIDSVATNGWDSHATYTCLVQAPNAEDIYTEDKYEQYIRECMDEDLGTTVYAFDIEDVVPVEQPLRRDAMIMTRMARIGAIATAFLLLITLLMQVNAQSPLVVSSAVFERVHASVVDCEPASVVLNEDLSSFNIVHCGAIGDTLTDINKRWTIEKLEYYGYSVQVPWRYSVNRHGVGVYIAGLYHPALPNVVVALGVAASEGLTVIVLAY